MTQRLKRWESPRRQGRNDKGRGGAARQRQLKKREKRLRQQLKAQARKNNQNNNNSGGENQAPPSFLVKKNGLREPSRNTIRTHSNSQS